MTKSRGILKRRRYWSAAELAELRRLWPAHNTAEIARRLGRARVSVYQKLHALGLKRRERAPELSDAERGEIRRFNAEGYPDTEIAGRLGRERHTVGEARKAMGLPCQGKHERWREKVRENTRRQCEEAGVKSLGELRSRSFEAFVRDYGLPEGLRVRAVQIFTLLAERGPSTRAEIAVLLGMDVKMKSNSPHGSYLADLRAAGLVDYFHRSKPGGPKGGRLTGLYSISGAGLALLDARKKEATHNG